VTKRVKVKLLLEKPDGTPFTMAETSDLVLMAENTKNDPSVKYVADIDGDIFRVSGIELKHMKQHCPIVLNGKIEGPALEQALRKRYRVLDET
jgi:hypothetical protein